MGPLSSSQPQRVVAVVARPLVAGSVKTRLAAAIGDEAALAVYARLLADTMAAVERQQAAAVLALTGLQRDVFGRLETLSGADRRRAATWRLTAQRGAHLGERLANLLDDLLETAGDREHGAAGADDGSTAPASALIVNSDSPALPPEFLAQAFEALEEGAEVALGPAADGGFYLVGTTRSAWRRARPRLRAALVGAPLGGPAAFDHVAASVRSGGLRLATLPLWLDIDRPADLPYVERLSARAADGAGLRGEPLQQLREVYLHVTDRCGRRCRHCYNASHVPRGPELTTGDWLRVIDDACEAGAKAFVFIGGDPLLRHDLTELVDHITGARERGARFFFNCAVDEERAGALAAAGHGRLRPLPSIDGTREVNDRLRGRGAYDDVIAAVRRFVGAGLDPVVNTVLLRPVLPTLPQLAQEIAAAGVRRLHLILPHQHGSLPGDLDLVPTGAEMLAALRALEGPAQAAGVTVDNFASWRRRLRAAHDLCTAGCSDLAVDPYGHVHACTITVGDPRFVAGDVRRRPLAEIWRTSPVLRLLRAAHARDREECAVCPVVDACGGECWVQAHYAARSRGRAAGYSADFPYCGLVRPVFEEMLCRTDAVATSPPACAPMLRGAGGQASAGVADYALFDCI